MKKTEIMELIPGQKEISPKTLSHPGEVLRSGGLVVFPTETVYGLGGNALDPAAAGRIYAAKGRPADNPLIIHIASPEDAEQYTYTTPLYYRLAEAFMPGPLTVILPARPGKDGNRGAPKRFRHPRHSRERRIFPFGFGDKPDTGRDRRRADKKERRERNACISSPGTRRVLRGRASPARPAQSQDANNRPKAHPA